MSTGEPTTTATTAPTPPTPKPPKAPKVVRHIHENAPAADTGKKATEGGGFMSSALGILGGLAIGGLLAAGVVLAVKHREKVKAFIFPAPRESRDAEQ